MCLRAEEPYDSSSANAINVQFHIDVRKIEKVDSLNTYPAIDSDAFTTSSVMLGKVENGHYNAIYLLWAS